MPVRGLPQVIVFALLTGCGPAEDAADAQDDFVANYDESLVPAYTLPDPLVTLAGEAVTDVDMWEETPASPW